MMAYNKTSKAHRFRLWVIGLLFVVVSVSIVFVHLERQPSEPFVSVSILRPNGFGPAVVEVTNRMSFRVLVQRPGVFGWPKSST